MLHKSHSAVSRPTLLVVVANCVLVVRVRVLAQISLDELPRFLLGESINHIDLINVSCKEPNRMSLFDLSGFEVEVRVRFLR